MTKLEQNNEQIGFVFIYGAGLHSEIWSQVVAELHHPYLLVDYPHREGDLALRQKLSLQDYITGINQQIEVWGVQKFVIVAHSLGGVLALKVAEEMRARVVGFVAVGAVIPPDGGSFLSVFPWVKRSLMTVLLGTLGTKPPEQAIRQGLCSDLTQEQADDIVRRFTPESVRVYTDRVHARAPQVPSLYIKLAKDNELDPQLQDQMIRNMYSCPYEVIGSGHLPMLSQPDELRQTLRTFLSQLPTE